jgi:hypothetical protein
LVVVGIKFTKFYKAEKGTFMKLLVCFESNMVSVPFDIWWLDIVQIFMLQIPCRNYKAPESRVEGAHGKQCEG